MNKTSSGGFALHVLCTASLALLAADAAAQDGSLAFSTAPATNTHRPPAPIVIISVDDSGSMSGNKMSTLKAALADTFKKENVPDGSIRLAWQAMNRCFSIPAQDGGCMGRNGARIIDEGHRKSFLEWVGGNSLKASGNTPAHRMLDEAGKYLQRTDLGVDSPWAEVPGEKEGELLSCRRAYSVFLTDGEWNYTYPIDGYHYDSSGRHNFTGNEDNKQIVLPDAEVYDPNHSSSRVFRGNTAKMFADLAFKYWSIDLQPNIDNNLSPVVRQYGGETVSHGGRDYTIPEYWNPKNNPATWQHLTLYAIGFGSGAASWNDFPKWGGDTWSGQDYNSIVVGSGVWGSAKLPDMWHAAINSRGKFVPVRDSNDLAPAFKEILNQIIVDNSHPKTSVALTASTVRRDSRMYVATYDPANWTGAVSAHKVTAGSGAVDAESGGWNSAAVMDEKRRNNVRQFFELRKIFTHNGSSGAEFKWDPLSAKQKLALRDGGDEMAGRYRMDYLRGGEDKNFRQRSSVHGDIVNSQVWYYNGDAANLRKPNKKTGAAQRRMVYVGANDGMLHAFDADNGSEAFAYVPLGVYDHLAELTRPDYVHRYFVDGSPFVAEVNAGSKDAPQWRDYLVGTLGAGGKGYFILDVTDPENFSAANVKLDKTGADVDADIGHIFSAPVTDQVTPTRVTQLTRLNNGKWAFVTGNGYNSVNQNSVLLIQYLDGQLGKLTAEPASKVPGNGLSAPRLVDLTGDGVPDVAYAGDLSGNLWKFDISSKDESKWKVSFAGQPLFTATDGLGQPQPQPITTAPGFVRHPSEPGLILTFGTGRNLTNEDRRSDDPQTIYGIHDRSGWTISNGIASVQDDAANRVERDDLVNKSLLAHATQDNVWKTDADDADEQVSYATTQWVNGQTVSVTPDRGWYIDLPVEKSRVLANVEWFRDPAIFRVRFQVPAEGGAGGVAAQQESCEPVYSERRDFLGYFDAVSGNSWRKPLPNGERDPYTFYEDPAEGLSHYLNDGEGGDVSVAPPGSGKEDNLPGEGFTGLIPTWRHVQ